MIRAFLSIASMVCAIISAIAYGGSSLLVWMFIGLYFAFDYWVFRDRHMAIRDHQMIVEAINHDSTEFQQHTIDLYNHYDRERDLEKHINGSGNVLRMQKADVVLDLRLRPPSHHHTVRLVQAIQKTDDGKVIKVVGDGSLKTRDFELSCEFTGSIFRGWSRDSSGNFVGYIYKVPEPILSNDYVAQINHALETHNVPTHDPKLESYIWNIIKEIPAYERKRFFEAPIS